MSRSQVRRSIGSDLFYVTAIPSRAIPATGDGVNGGLPAKGSGEVDLALECGSGNASCDSGNSGEEKDCYDAVYSR